MKVLLCERNFAGHRAKYLERMAQIPGVEFFCYAPENIGFAEDHFFAFDPALRSRRFSDYFKWIAGIRTIVRSRGIDLVHILDGDSIMRFFGLGFASFGDAKVVVTYHHFFEGTLRKLSYHGMLAAKRSVAVAHTENVLQAFEAAGIDRVRLCEYPAFDFDRIAGRDPVEAKNYWKVPQNVPVIGMIGGMSAYKNMLSFLTALQNCREPFHVLICGKPGDVSVREIEECIAGYRDKVTLVPGRMSEDGYDLAVAASDIVFCVYGHSFDGASGPLTDGVCARKLILSCEHGSLGHIVRNSHLGLTAETDDPAQVLAQTEEALRMAKDFAYDETAVAYRDSLKPECFLEKYRRIYEDC